jgi:hypothetical protein
MRHGEEAAHGEQLHVHLGGPTADIQILPELTLNVPAEYGHIGSPLGFQVTPEMYRDSRYRYHP